MKKTVQGRGRTFKVSAVYRLLRDAIVGWGAGRRQAGDRPVAKPRRESLILEGLEPRLLLSADPVTTLAGGVLQATLTDGADTVLIEQAGTSANGGVIVRLTVNGTLASYGDSSTGVTHVQIQGLSGDDRFKLNSPLGATLSIDGGEGLDTFAGADVANAWTLAGVGAGTINGAVFSGIENLVGGSAADVFTLSAGGVLAGTMDGGAGVDSLVGPDARSAWVLEGAPGSGTLNGRAFVGFENLAGGSGDDVFKIQAGVSLAGLLDGGGGSNAIVGADSANTWRIAAGANQGNLNSHAVVFRAIQNLIGGTRSDTFVFEAGAHIDGILDAGRDADHDGDGMIAPDELAVDTVDYALYATPVTVDIGTGKTSGTAGYANVDVFVGAASAGDTVKGPSSASVVWTVDGPDAVSVGGVAFAGFEHLLGADNNTDVFLIEGGGSWSGTVHGGAGGSDGLVFVDPDDADVSDAFNPAGADSSGVATAFSKSIAYSGLDRIDYFNAADPFNVVVTGTIFNDAIRVFADLGGLRIEYAGDPGKTIALDALQVAQLQSLRIDGIEGADTITVESLPDGFAGSLLLYGNRLQRSDLIYPSMPEDDLYADTVIFSGDIALDYLEVFADHIRVQDNVHIATGDSGIFFRSRMLGVSTLENLLPVFVTSRSVSVDIGENAVLEGGSIYFVLQAEDKSFSDTIGVGQEVSNFIIEPLSDFLGSTLALPVKLLVKESSASITLQQGSRFLSSGTIGMYATATADASGVAAGSVISVGYGQATATATIDIRSGVVIDAAAAAVITSTANATADISASASRSGILFADVGVGGGVLEDNSPPLALAIGVANASVTSRVTVAHGASITAGKTANVTAGGDISTSANGEAGLDENGVAGLAFGIQISNADIHTLVEGSITARMEPGAVVKLEIDPLVAKSDFTSDQTVFGLKSGKTVELTADVVGSALSAGTVMKYIGASVADTVLLAAQDFTDAALWEVSTPSFGYVDYDTDRIFLGDTALVTEDVITYTNRRGTSVGGLVDGTAYYVIADLDHAGYFWLAETETQAIRASLGYLANNVVPLSKAGWPTTENNDRPFDGTNVDADANTIALQRVAAVNNTFELGQAVVFHAPSFAFTSGDVLGNTIRIAAHGLATGDRVTYDGVGIPASAGVPSLEDGATYYVTVVDADRVSLSLAPGAAALVLQADKSTAGKAAVQHKLVRAIDGLVDGGTYYVAASTGQTNLQGDTRFTETQVIGLAESENEARAGVLIDIGPVTGSGYTLSAKHVLDSGFATGVGVVATLDAENNASSNVGLAEAGDTTLWSLFTDALDTTPGNVAEAVTTAAFLQAAGSMPSLGPSPLSVGLGLTISHIDHSVLTDVASSAVLRSNEDLEVKALISETYSLGAESNSESAAAVGVSVSVNVANISNTAIATVHSDTAAGGPLAATLDALRATRVISEVAYPFLTRPDEYIPLSWGELVDSIRSEGPEAITKYLTGTFGAKEAFFNSWAASTSEAESVSIAASVNVIVENNVSQAIVEAGVRINQDLSWHEPGAANDHGNQAAHQGDGKGEEVVSIEATNYAQLINMTGIFSLPGLEIDPLALAGEFKGPSAFGGQGGQKGGAGGAVFVSTRNNTTHAIIEDGAAVYSGADGGFNMKAEEAMLNVNLVQSGASGGDFVLAGSIATTVHHSDTLVQLGATTRVTGRDARLYAGDLTTNVNWVGGIATGETLGIGFSIAVNEFNRKTRAIIGDPDAIGPVAGPATGASTIDVSGVVDVLAKDEGELWAFAIAGAGAVTDKDGRGLAIAGVAAAGFNKIDSQVLASVRGSVIDAGGGLVVTATDNTRIVGVSGGGALAAASGAGGGGGSQVALAVGLALAHNTVDSDVMASITDSVVGGGGDVVVHASNNGAITGSAVAVAVSAAFGQNGFAVSGGGAESTNVVAARTNAFIADSAIGGASDPIGDVDVAAINTANVSAFIGSFALAAGGGFSAGAGVAIGVSVARNFIGWNPAGDDSVIPDYASNQAPLVRLETGRKVLVAEGALAGDIYEYIGETQVVNDDPGTPDYVEGIYLQSQQYRDPALWKHVNASANTNQVRAFLADSSVVSVGDVTLHASDTSRIDATVLAIAVGIGGGGDVGVGVSGAGVYAENRIKTDVAAFIDGDGDRLATDGIMAGSVRVSAVDSSSINAVAGAGALAAGFGGTAGIAAAIGLSLAFNEIDNDVAASIRNADQGVTATTGGVTVSAVTQGQHLFDLTVGGLLSAASLDDAAKADSLAEVTFDTDSHTQGSDKQDVRQGDTVMVLQGYDAAKGVAGNIYRYLPDTTGIQNPLDLGIQNYLDTTRWQLVEAPKADAHSDRLILEALRAAFADQGEDLAVYDTIAPAAPFTTADGVQAMAEGSSVQVAQDYALGGMAGRVYRYFGASGDVDLGAQNYADTSKWILADKLKVSTLVPGQSWTLVAPDGATYALELTDAGTISVNRNSINAVSVAASVAVGLAGQVGVAVSGAGAVAQNVILSRANAFGQDSIIDSVGDVTLSATSTSTISSAVVAVSAAVGVGGGVAGVGASIGVAVARNFIGWTPGAGVETPAQVRAYLMDSSVRTDGALTQTAIAGHTIHSVVVSGSVAVGGGTWAGVAASGAGVFAENKIGVDVKSFIDGDRSNGITGIAADSITLKASDDSSIRAVAAAVSVGLAGGFVGASVSVGVSLARNTITSDVDAYITHADGVDSDADDFGVTATTAGGITISATEVARISAVSAAASLAAAGGAVGIGISGAGADAHNVLLTGTHAYVQNSAVSSGGKVDIDASNAASIGATIVGVSVGVGGGIVGVAGSIGVTIARNYIGYGTDEDVVSDYDTADNPGFIASGKTVKIAAGANAGNIYQYIGTANLLRPDGDATWLTRIDYSDITRWELVNLERRAAQVQAFVLDSHVNAAGALTLDAVSDQEIQATVIAASVALSGGAIAGSISGAGAGAENRIATQVQAFIQGDKGDRGIRAASVALDASDTSRIESLTGAISVAAAFGLGGASLSIGVGIAHNTVDNDVASFIQDVDAGVTTTTGDITVAAHESASIDAAAFAAAAAAGVGGVGAGVSGAGVFAGNTILGSVDAYADNSVLTSAGDVVLVAENASSIEARTLGIAVAVGAGILEGAALSIGAALAENTIGSGVHAVLRDTSVDAAGDLSVIATADQRIDAAVTAVSVAVSSGAFGGGLSGAGASAVNHVSANVHATIDGSDPGKNGPGPMGIEAGSVTLRADDLSSIDADVAAVSVAVSFALGGGAIAVGISTASNTIDNVVEAYATTARIGTTTGDLTITAVEDATITSEATAASVAVTSVVAAAGSGAQTHATIDTTTRAYADPVELDVAGGVHINALSTSSATGTASGTAVAVAVIPIAGAVSKATVVVSPTVESRLGGFSDGRQVLAQGNIEVMSTLGATGAATAVGDALAIGFGVAVGETTAITSIVPTVSSTVSGGHVVSTGGGLDVRAVSTEHANADARAAAGAGLVGASGATANAIVTPTLDAHIGGTAVIDVAGAIVVEANDSPEGDATNNVSGSGFVGTAGSLSLVTVTPTVRASIGSGTQVHAGAVAVSAVSKAIPALELINGLPTYAITGVDADNDLIAVANHQLSTGDVIEYQSGNDNQLIGGLAQSYVANPNIIDDATGNPVTTERQYGVLNVALASDPTQVDPDRIALGAEFSGADIDADGEIIRFAAPHKLLDGDRVVYRPGDPTLTIPGLAAGASYTVRVIDANRIQLVAPGELNPFLVGNVAGDGITINDANTFTDHQAVTYHAPPQQTFSSGQVDVVLGTDVNGNPELTDAPDLDNIRFYDEAGDDRAHGFAHGERVVYGVTGGSVIGGLVDGTTYRVLGVDASSLRLAPTLTTSVTFTRAVGGGTPAQAFMTGADWAAFGFAAGQSFTISGGGANNGSYTVAGVDGNTLRISTDFASAGVFTKTVDGDTAVALSPDKTGTAVHSLVRPGDQAFANLVDGQTYYILNPTAGSYQLTTSATGTTAVTLGGAGLSGTAQHWIGTESIDLSAGSGSQQLRIDLTSSTLPAASQKIVGAGGVSLVERLPLLGDGVSTASAIGSGNGFVGAGNNRSEVRISADVTATVASTSLSTTRVAGSLIATGDVSVHADSLTNANTRASNSAGGFVGAGTSGGTIDQASATTATIAAGANVGADGDVTVRATSLHVTRGFSQALAGGFAADVHANMDSTVHYETQADLRSGAKVVAGGHVDVSAIGNLDGLTRTYADGRGFGGGGYANTNFTVTDGSRSTVTIGDNAIVTADTLALRALTTQMRLRTEASGVGAGFVAVSKNNSNLTVDALNTVLIGSGANLSGYKGVDIAARFTGVNTFAYSQTKVMGVFGYLESNPRNLTSLVSGVVADPRTLVPRAQVTAGPRDRLDGDLSHPVGDAGSLDYLALHVDTTNQIIRIDRDSDIGRYALAAGGDNGELKDNQTRKVTWNADVHILGQSPELVIGAHGEILKAVNVSVRTAANAQQTSGTIAAGEAEVFVNDLRNSSSGQVYFNDGGDATGDGTVSIGGSGSTWDFSDTYRQVLITNHSNKTLRINNIDVVNTVANPLVDLNGKNVSLTFAVDRVVTPTLVQILNLSTSDVILNGAINDPIGSTVIRNSGGAISAARARDAAEAGSGRVSLVTTAILDLHTPASDIGSASTRVNVDMVYGDSALPATHFRTTDVADLADAVFLGSGSLFDGQLVRYETTGAAIGGLVDGNYYVVLRAGNGASIQLATRDADGSLHTVALDPSTAAAATMHVLTPAQQVVGVAAGDIYLDLKARLRAEAAVESVTATVDTLRAGGTIDLLLQDSVQEYGASASAGVRVTTLNETTVPLPSTSRDRNFASFFRPDGGAARFQDLGAFGGSTQTPRDTVYDFRDLDTSGNRTMAGLIAGDTDGNIIVTARQSQPAEIQISVVGITDILGSGHIDVLTNGSIVLAEHAGDMRVGDIHSTADDVTLTAPASIVDALADTAADVTGVNITLTALGGRIGSAGNFLETDLLDTVSGVARAGVLRADASLSIFIEETTGDLRVHHVASVGGNVTLVARNGSILDGNDDVDAAAADGRFRDADGRARDAVNVSALHIALDARGGGSIGLAGDDLDLDSRRGGHLFAQAAQNVYITETDGALEVVAARALGGDLRLTVPDTSAVDTENLLLLGSGSARVNEGADTVVSIGEIAAFATVALWIGDNVNTSAHSRIVAGSGISLRGDTRRVGKTDAVDATEVDDGHGTQMDLRGTIGFIDAPASVTVVNLTDKAFTGIYGHDDVDTFTFNQTRLDANTTVHGSWKTSGETLLAHDGEDRFIVNQLASMHVDRHGIGDTLTLDGQSDTDYYEIHTAGSQSADPQNYVINVLDTGAKDNGVDELKILGFDSGANGIGQAADDIFLLRAMTGIPSEASESPAFVALLHGTLEQAMAGTSPAQVERINYDANLNGRLSVHGLGGNDYFAVDDTSTIATLDGGAGDDSFQIGQLFGSQRSLGANLASSDVFGTVATTRGYLSRGNSAPLVAEGGSGNDVFQVYSNQAALRLEGNSGDDLFVVRAFALAETHADGSIVTDAAGVAIRKAGSSTAATEVLNGGEGNDFIQYNINAPVSIDGGTGFDKVVVLGTEFGDNFVITDQGVFGAGLNVSYANIELLEVDGLEGDDHFTIQSTPFGVATRVIGGLGNDIFNVAGDVTDVVTTQELEGQSGVINHEASSVGDLGYDGLLVPGINLNVAGLPGGGNGGLFGGNVIIDESDGMSQVRETASGEWGTVDSYTLRLAVPVAAGTRVYVTVSAARSSQEEQDAAGKGDSVLVSTDLDFVRDLVRNGDPVTERNRAVVLVFDSTNWNVAQTVHVAAANDGQEEGKRVVAVSHAVQVAVIDAAAASAADRQATIASYHGVKVRNVLVTVIDNDAAGIVLTENRTDAYDNGTLVLEGAAPYGITDSYTIALTKAPVAAVTIALDYDRAQLQLSHDSVTFDASNWDTPVTITVTAVNDTLREDQKLSLIRHLVSASTDPAYFAAGASTVSETLAVTVADDDVPGVLVRQSNGTTQVAAGVSPISDTYTVRLNAAPTGTVTIVPHDDGTTTASAVSFDAGNWWLPQLVTVTAVPITDPASALLHPGVKAFAVQPHLLCDIKGTLEIEGGVGATVYPLIPAVMLPGETNAPVLG
ncbi:MAG: LEPR-XLL domain-containing protein, partial [Rhodoferax sp.]|nr:LEPR-XLL domain-containing protein [Rhodoferax sp.]